MKKLTILTILATGALSFSGCSQDTDSNPTYKQPETFVLNTPSFASSVYDLENSITMTFACTQPDYGFTAAPIYAVQLSLTDVWTDETTDASATYETLSATSTTAKMTAETVEIDKAIVRLSKWKQEEDCPNKVIKIFIRLKASLTDLCPDVYSNSIELNVLPYYIELKDAAPSFFFLIGNYIGGWDTGFKDIGASTIPMSLEKDYEYDKKTGVGKFTYTGYFEAATKDNGFKLIGMIDGKIDWKEQWGNGNDGDLPGNTALVHLHNGSSNPGHIGVDKAGWYKMEVDDVDKTLKFTLLNKEPVAAYESIQLLGDFSSWEDNPVEMKQIGKMTHSWTTTVTFDKPGVAKFRANRAWDVNWGSGVFPFALGEQGGKDIPVQPGTYIVTFNDIEGSYCFFLQ